MNQPVDRITIGSSDKVDLAFLKKFKEKYGSFDVPVWRKLKFELYFDDSREVNDSFWDEIEETKNLVGRNIRAREGKSGSEYDDCVRYLKFVPVNLFQRLVEGFASFDADEQSQHFAAVRMLLEEGLSALRPFLRGNLANGTESVYSPSKVAMAKIEPSDDPYRCPFWEGLKLRDSEFSYKLAKLYLYDGPQRLDSDLSNLV